MMMVLDYPKNQIHYSAWHCVQVYSFVFVNYFYYYWFALTSNSSEGRILLAVVIFRQSKL